MKYATYYRDLLKPDERRAYDALAKGLRTVKGCFFLPGNCFHASTRAMQALQLDATDLFYLDLTNIPISLSGLIAQCRPHFLDSPQECLRKRSAILQLGKQIVSKISHMNDLDKEMAIIEYLASHVTYGKLSGLDEPRSYTVEGALLTHRAVCMGYSRAFNFLCRLAGIPAILVEGIVTSRPAESHCWNLVEIGGLTYHVDVTNTQIINGYLSRSLINLSDTKASKFLTPSGNQPIPTCPASMNLIPMAKSGPELLRLMHQGVQSGEHVFQIAINHHFTDIQTLISFVERKLTTADYTWYNRLVTVHYDDLDVITIFTR